eukprot:1159938-Pelagomonas_calceolata.AAC.2
MSQARACTVPGPPHPTGILVEVSALIMVHFYDFGLDPPHPTGILIEDQIMPKSCGHVKGKRVTSREEAVSRIKAAVDASQPGIGCCGCQCAFLTSNGGIGVMHRKVCHRYRFEREVDYCEGVVGLCKTAASVQTTVMDLHYSMQRFSKAAMWRAGITLSDWSLLWLGSSNPVPWEEGADILILARTDARQAISLDEALWRAAAFAGGRRLGMGWDCMFCGSISTRAIVRKQGARCGVEGLKPQMNESRAEELRLPVSEMHVHGVA